MIWFVLLIFRVDVGLFNKIILGWIIVVWAIVINCFCFIESCNFELDN